MLNESNTDAQTTHTPVVEKRSRLVGLDLFRGIAAFAVVILHSDEGVKNLPYGWSAILKFASFAVPFFLAVSFYLTIDRLCTDDKPVNWRLRLLRMSIPYAIWSLIYLSLNLLRYLVKNQPEKIGGLFQNTLGIIFLGQAAFHLYFIPLLISGTLVVMTIEPLIRRPIKFPILLGFLAFSLIVYQTQFLPADAVLNSNKLIHVALVIMGYTATCLPYIAIALLLNHPTIRNRLTQFDVKHTVLLLIVFCVFNAFELPWLPSAVHKILIAYFGLLLALALSNSIKPNPLILSVSKSSFGIYLMHLMVVNTFWSIIQSFRFIPESMSILALLGVATLGFLVSWTLTFLLMKQKLASRLLFGA